MKQQEAALAIPAIQSVTGQILTRPQDIVDEFSSFYEVLYSPEAPATLDHINDFLTRVQLPCLTEDGRALLEGDISALEISQDIAKLPHMAQGYPYPTRHQEKMASQLNITNGQVRKPTPC